jgi:hypothetical protein
MDKEYFVITGMPRSGTKFLSKFLNEHPRAVVAHEEPTSSWPKRFKPWIASKKKVIGMVNSNARFYMREIEIAARPLWGFLLRDPISLVTSCTAKKPGGRTSGMDNAMRATAVEVFGGLESTLMLARDLGITMHLWRFDEIVTPKGFAAISTWCGLNFGGGPPEIRPIHATKEGQRLPPTEEWPVGLEKFVIDTAKSFPLLSQAYREVGITF